MPDEALAVGGGGPAARAAGFHLRRTTLRWRILDDQPGPGGAWRHAWESLQGLSPRDGARSPASGRRPR